MLKIVIFTFFVAGHFESHAYEEPLHPELDNLGNCITKFPKDHVMRRGCYSAHALCRRFNLDPNYVDRLILNNKAYNEVEMKLPSGASIPYSIYEMDPSLFAEIYPLIFVQTDPPIVLDEYREIVNDPDFRIAKGLHRTHDQTLLTEMITIMLEYIRVDDVTAIVGDWFQGDLKIIAPLIKDYLPELENVTVVKIANNYPKLSMVRQIMNERNVVLEKVNPSALTPVTMNDDEELRVEEIRQILDLFKSANNATVLPGVDFQLLDSWISDGVQLDLDDALPMWEWMKVHDEIHLKNYHYTYHQRFPVIMHVMSEEGNYPTPSDYTTESTTSATTATDSHPAEIHPVQDTQVPSTSAGPSVIPSFTTQTEISTAESLGLYDIKQPKVDEPGSHLNKTAHPDYQSTISSTTVSSEESSAPANDGSPSPIPSLASSTSEPQRNVNSSPQNPNHYKPFNASGKSSDDDDITPSESSSGPPELNLPHKPIDASTPPSADVQYPKLNTSGNHLPGALSFFSPHTANGNASTNLQNKIFTTCALYYLKVNGTQNRIILSEAGILSIPMKRICDELLRLEIYNGSHVERLGEKRGFEAQVVVNKSQSMNAKDEDLISLENQNEPLTSALVAASTVNDINAKDTDDSPQPEVFSFGSSTRTTSESGLPHTDTPYKSAQTTKVAGKSAADNQDSYRHPEEFPFSPPDNDDLYDRSSHKRDLDPTNHRSLARPRIGPPAANRIGTPSGQTFLADADFTSFTDEEYIGEGGGTSTVRPHHPRPSPRTKLERYSRDPKVPRRFDETNEMGSSNNPHSRPELEEESDSAAGFATNQSRYSWKRNNRHFRETESVHPAHEKTSDEPNSRSVMEKLKSLREEEIDNNEGRRKYFSHLNDDHNTKDYAGISVKKQPKSYKPLKIHSVE